MRKIALPILLALAACSAAETSQREELMEMQGWQLASGKAASRAEYAAVVAACRDGDIASARAKPLDACLAELGLKRAPSR